MRPHHARIKTTMQKHFTRPQRHLQHILRQLHLDGDSEQAVRYRQLLDACLPAMWRERVLLGSVEGLRWQLWVANGSDGTRLRFLLSEIQNALAQKLPHPPQLGVTVRPDIWAQQRRLPAPMQLHQRHDYTEEEADAVISAFINSLR